MTTRNILRVISNAFLCSLLIFILFPVNAAWSASAPAAPTNLIATAASSRQLNLSWKDNATNETNYYVERAPTSTGTWTQIASLGANATSYSDTGLTQNTTYYYRVRCAAGTTYSKYSSTASATTATLAAPTALIAAVDPASPSINLSWTDNTAYETLYSIERAGSSAGPYTVIGTVATNVTTTTNTGLATATPYYYRVRAYDGTNYSAYSNVATQTIYTITASAGANGSISPTGTVVVNSGATQTFTITPNTSYHVSDVQVDGSSVGAVTTYTFNNVTSNHTITASFANSTSVSGPITANTTWMLANSPYIVTGSVQVYGTSTTPVTLTIEPGVVVKFASGANLQIGNGTSQGALIAQGTPTNHITMTRNAASGTWSGLNFQDGTVDGTTVLQYVDIQYSTGVTMNSASPTIRNSTITDVTGYGLNLTSSNPTIDTVTIANNGAYGIYLSSSSPTITGGSLTNASTNGNGVYGNGSPSISNYSVFVVNTAGYYGINLSTTTSAFSLTNSTIGNGLYLGSTGIVPTVTGNTFTNADTSPIHAGANVIGQIMNNNTMNNMTAAGRIEVVGEQVSQDAEWKKWAAPYSVVSGFVSVYKDATSPATLTIDPGVVIMFASSYGLYIGSSTSQGAIIAKGTATDHITLTRSGSSGTWWGIRFQDGTVDSTSIFEYVDVQYGGGVDIFSSSPTIRNSTINDPNTYGLNLSSANPLIDTVTVTSNGSYGITMASSSPTIRNSTITNTGTYGLYLSSSNPVLDTVTVSNNGSYGIYLNSSSPSITNGSLTNTSATGYGIYGSGSPIITNYNISIVNTVGYYGLYLSSSSSSLSVTNSMIANGLYISSTGILPTITGNTFTNADNSPIHAGANIIAQILSSNTINGMTSAGRIEVVGEQINRDTEWQNLVAPYVVTGWVNIYKDATTAATLTIDPGAIVKFSSGLQVGNGTSQGALVARGTPSNRITFTRSGSSGNWSTITFNDGTVDSTTILENVDIQFSGGIVMNSASPTFRNSTITDVSGYGFNLTSSNPLLDTVTITNNGTYGIYMISSSPTITGGSLTNTNSTGSYYGIYGSYGSPVISNYNVSIVNAPGKYGASFNAHPSLSVTNSTIANGLYISGTNPNVTITGNTFTNADNSPIHAGANSIAQIMNNNTVTGMTSTGRIEVTGEQISQDATWQNWPAPYVVLGSISVYKDTTTASTLTIAPGAVLKFSSGANLNVGLSGGAQKGKLVARGTADNHITFTRNETSGYWGQSLYGSLNFYSNAGDGAIALEYADIQHGYSVIMTSSSPIIKDTTFTDMSGSGLSLTSSNPMLQNVTVSNNGNYSIYLGSSSPTITGSNFTNTWIYGSGINGSGSPVISNCTISITNTAGYYGLYTSTTTTALSVTNSTISNGLYIGTTGIAPTITGNIINGADFAPIHAGANIIDQIFDNNTVNGMTSAGRIEVAAERISRNVRWKNWQAPYWVMGSFDIYNDTITPSSLTIDPGVAVKFAGNYRINVGSSANKGSLIAQGTAASRIKFTRSGTSGTWLGFTFNDGTVDGTETGGTVFEYVDIEYTTGIWMYTCVPIFRNSTINDQSSGQALYLLSGANPVLDNVSITANGTYGINLGGNASPVITGGSLTNLNSNGYGIYGAYNATQPNSPVIANYTISIVNTPGKYGLSISSATSALSITNSTIGNGLYLNATGITPTITGNTFTNGDNSPLRAGANIIDRILDNNTMTGLSSAGRIEIVGEQVTRDVRWKKWVAPYYFPNGYAYVYQTDGTTPTLTIDPGVTLKFNSYGLQVGNYGSSARGKLIAQGTADNKILFTSGQATPAPGDWSGVSIKGNAASASVIENAIFEYGGACCSSTSANVTFDQASPIMRNCTIRNGGGSGVYVVNATAWPVIMDSEVTGNKWGVYSNSSNPTIYNTTITGNTTAGVTNASTMDVDARGSWWGAATGPTYSGNPQGTGDKISDHVLYNPWLGQAPGSGFGFTDTRVLPSSLNPIGGYVTFSATISAPANWTLTVTYTDSQNNTTTVRTFTGTGSFISQKWYGDDSTGNKVADGAYYYHISAINIATSETAMSPTGLIMVSRQIPIANMDPPQDNQMFRAGETIRVTGTASDADDFKYYTLDYGQGDNPAYWTSLVWQQIGTTPVTNGLIYTWDTSSLTGTLYTLRLTVVDNAGNTTVDTARVRFLQIQNALVTNPYFSPNGDGIKDTTTINASFTYKSDWTITVQDTFGSVVKTFTGSDTSVSQVWDGKNDLGQLVSDGTYTWTLSAIGSGTTTTATPVSGAVTVDTVLPLAQITTPTAGAVLWNAVPVTGTAYDLNLDNYRIEYSPAGSGGPWSAAAQGTASVTNGTLGTWVTNDATNAVLVANGNYDLRLVVTDKAGNSSTAAIPVGTDNLILSNVGATSHALNTLTNDVSTISYSINEPATVNFKIIPEKQGPTGTPVRQASQVVTAGTYSFTWDGKDNTGKVVPDEAYIYVLSAGDGTKTDSYGPPTPAGTGSLACTQSAYDPYKNNPMTITYSLSQPARVSITAPWAYTQYQVVTAIPQAYGSQTVIWDGRSPSGAVLAPYVTVTCSIASYLPEDIIITSGDTPLITAIQADPYVLHVSYGQITSISYTLSREAVVTVMLYPPSGSAITLLDNQLQEAGSHTLPEWTGLDPADPTGKRLLPSGGGNYTILIKAVNPQTGTTSIARGSVIMGL